MLLPVLVGLGDEAGVSLAPDVGSDCYSVDEDCGFGSGGVPGGAEQPWSASGDDCEVGECCRSQVWGGGSAGCSP